MDPTRLHGPLWSPPGSILTAPVTFVCSRAGSSPMHTCSFLLLCPLSHLRAVCPQRCTALGCIMPLSFPASDLVFSADPLNVCVLFSRKVQWSHLASLKSSVSPVSRSHSFSDPSPPKFAHHHLRSQDPCPPSRSEAPSQSSDPKSEVPDPAPKAWSRSDSDEVPPRVRSRQTGACLSFVLLNVTWWILGMDSQLG